MLLFIVKVYLGSLLWLQGNYILASSGGRQVTTHPGKLCDFLSEKAINQRKKLCQFVQSNERVLHKKRSVNTTFPEQTTGGNVTGPQPTTTRRTPDSYVCRSYEYDVNGFDPKGLGLELRVNFTKVNNEWEATVIWDRPLEGTQTKCIGYYVLWYKDDVVFSSPYCDKIMNENDTRYTIDSSKGWIDYSLLGVAVFPLPVKSNSTSSQLRYFTVSPSPTATKSQTTEATNVTSTTSSDSSSNDTSQTTGSTKATPSYTPLEGAMKTSSPKFVIILFVVLGVLLVVAMFGLFVARKLFCSRHPCVHGTNGKAFFIQENPMLKGKAHYITYYPDNETIMATVIKIASWLAQNNIRIIIDKFDVITRGKRIWREQHLAMAHKVIIMLSPGYLKICKFDESADKDKTLNSVEDQLAYNDICHIQDELRKKPLATDRFLVVLVGSGVNELPFWMKRLKVYKCTNGSLDDKILKELEA